VTTTAPPNTPAVELGDELVRETRRRYANGGARVRQRLAFAATGAAVMGAMAASAIFLSDDTRFSLWRIAFFVLLYAIVSRVEFEVGPGSAIPTELVLVPMLFALPVGSP
jgi:hypothetical protein